MEIISPMLASAGNLTDLKKQDYLFEPKMDGVRGICYVNESIRIYSRNGRDITYQYPEFNWRKSVKAKECILDGEIVVYSTDSKPSSSLWKYRNALSDPERILTESRLKPATYVVFDILMKNGKKLTSLTIEERKKILEKTIQQINGLEKMIYFEDGESLFTQIVVMGIEGVVAKAKGSKYRPGKRSQSWKKIKNIDYIGK